MPMNDAALGAEIKDALIAALGGPGQIRDDGRLTQISNGIAKAVVDHIKANALVTGSSATGGPVTGTVS
jgi:hypothetical protein